MASGGMSRVASLSASTCSSIVRFHSSSGMSGNWTWRPTARSGQSICSSIPEAWSASYSVRIAAASARR